MYTDYNIQVTNDLEIAINIDSTIHEFIIDDTISNKNIWSNKIKYPLYHRDISDPFWNGSKEFYLGFRSTNGLDTLYSWIYFEINYSGFLIKEFAILK